MGWEYLTHQVTWLIDHVIMWYTKKALSPPSLEQWPPTLAKLDLSWVDHNHRLLWFIYHVITLYSQKVAPPVSQRQWPLNLVGFRVTCQSSNHLLFENRPVSPNARQQNSSGDIKHRKSHKSKVFFVIQKILIFNSHRYTPL